MRHKARRRAESSDGDSPSKRSAASRVLNSAADGLLLALAAFMVVAGLGPVTGWWHYEVVESGSMTPALRVGGVAVVTSEPVSAVHVGQILVFHPPGQHFVRIHRVVALSQRGNQVWIRTKGDANNVADPGPVRLEGKTAFTESFFVPYVGYGAVWLYKRSTRTALEVVFFVLMVLGGLYLIWGSREDDAEPEAQPRRWATWLRSAPPVGNLAAKRAATASMVSLNQIYSTEAEGGETGSGTEAVAVAKTSAS